MNRFKVIEECHNNNLYTTGTNLETSVLIKGSRTRAYSPAMLSPMLSDVAESEHQLAPRTPALHSGLYVNLLSNMLFINNTISNQNNQIV